MCDANYLPELMSLDALVARKEIMQGGTNTMISEADDSRQIRTWPLVASHGRVLLPHAVEVRPYTNFDL